MPRSYFVAFDGCDGSGKSLLSSLVRDYYRVDKGDIWRGRVLQTFMPGGTAMGAEIRKLLKDARQSINSVAERLLFAADNAQFIKEVIYANALTGKLVLCDRWSFFTDLCYGLPRGLDPAVLFTIQSVVPKARLDILFLLTTPFELCLNQMQSDHSRELTPCRIEKAGTEYLLAVWNLYMAAASEKPFEPAKSVQQLVWAQARKVASKVVVLDGTKSPTELRDIVVGHIDELTKGETAQCESKP